MYKVYFTWLLSILICVNVELYSQCSYQILDVSHVDCYNENSGEISVSITNSNSTFWWDSETGFLSNSSSISNLFAGVYVLNIMENFIPGDTTSPVICYLIDTIVIEQTIEINSQFILKNMNLRILKSQS